MPSFFETLKRMAQGKPVFEMSDEQKAEADKWKEDDAPIVDPKAMNQNVIPQVIVERVEDHPNDGHLDTYFALRNNSDVEVFLDKITVMNATRELDHRLVPQEEKEFLVYSGPIMTNPHYTDCIIQYRDTSGDYFVSRHHVEYEQYEAGTYTPRRVIFEPPVKDM